MLRLFSTAACFLLLTYINAQEKKAITHESMTLLKRVGAPEVSPDGYWVVFSLTEPSYTEKDVVNDLWIVATDASSKPRRLTFGKGTEGGYKWSPDSRQVAFTAKREDDEVAQVYIINIAGGGEAQRFSNLSTGAANPQWSPDGKKILYTNKVYPGNFSDSANKKTADEKKKVKYNARVYTSFPIRNWDVWTDEKQTHAFVQPVEEGSIAKDIFSGAALTRKEGFSFPGNICWAPDGKEVIFAASVEQTSSAYLDPAFKLYKLSIDGGDAVPITDDKNTYSNPSFSPDGKYLFCISTPINNNEVYNLGRLTRYTWPSFSQKTLVTPSLDRVVNSYKVIGDNIFLSMEDQGNDKIYSINISTLASKDLTKNNGSYTAVSCDTNGKVIVSSYDNASRPAEIVRINVDQAPQFLTNFNDAAMAKMDLQTPEIFWTTTSHGKKIRSMLIKPADFSPGKKYPLFVVMHGGPAGSWKDTWGYRWNYHLLAAPGYVLLLTDFTGSTGYGEQFSQEIQFDPLKGPATEINEAADDAIRKYSFIDGSRQAAGGGSYGGHLANWMQASTTRYKCLISHAGMVNSESQYLTSDYLYGREIMNGGPHWLKQAAWNEQNPIRFAAKFKTPVLITVGEKDFRVPLNNSIENFGLLQRLKIPSKLIVFPDENHWILKPENSRFWYREVDEWLRKYLGS